MLKKVIMNIFICEYNSPFWTESVFIFNSLNFSTSIQISSASYKGLAYQILLDINLDESIILSNNIIKKFLETPLIVISEVVIKMKSVPIGEWQDIELVEPGRYFDRLVRENVKGIFIK